jgi:pyridoxamine-phosphate oxidase
MSAKEFSEKTIDHDPFIQFSNWYGEHLAAGITIPDSVSLGTAFIDGKISVRTILLKDFSNDGFVFYTNYKSKKGLQLTVNPRAALLFYWPESARQVRIEGLVEKISDEDSVRYFHSRPRESQLSARASMQSSVIPDRESLENDFRLQSEKYTGKVVDKPETWGGYRLIPDWFEFWQEGQHRLHDRLTYTKKEDSWIIERLAP